MSIHYFNLMVITSKTGKVLTQYDLRWDMYLLPYKKAIASEEGSREDKAETDRISEHLATLFNVDQDTLNVQLVLRQFTRKYSKSDKVNKIYYHRFFKVMIDGLPDSDEFEIDGNKYRWWNINELEADPKTKESNSEIIAVVKNEILK